MSLQNDWDIDEELWSESHSSTHTQEINSPKLIADRSLEYSSDKNLLVYNKGGIKQGEKKEFLEYLNSILWIKLCSEKKSKSEEAKLSLPKDSDLLLNDSNSKKSSSWIVIPDSLFKKVGLQPKEATKNMRNKSKKRRKHRNSENKSRKLAKSKRKSKCSSSPMMERHRIVSWSTSFGKNSNFQRSVSKDREVYKWKLSKPQLKTPTFGLVGLMQ
jgi:hypothetical protein